MSFPLTCFLYAFRLHSWQGCPETGNKPECHITPSDLQYYSYCLWESREANHRTDIKVFFSFKHVQYFMKTRKYGYLYFTTRSEGHNRLSSTSEELELQKFLILPNKILVPTQGSVTPNASLLFESSVCNRKNVEVSERLP